MRKKEVVEEFGKPIKKKDIKLVEELSVCAHCNKKYKESDYGKLATFIMKHKPACSFECNKALGQV